MLDIAFECLKAVKNYTGFKLLFGLTLIAWFILFFKEKNKSIRNAFVIMPVIVMVVFVCPLTLYLYDRVGIDKDTYYRILWIIPMGIITVYAAVKLFDRGIRCRIIGALITVALIILFGKCVYTSDSFFKGENIYGIPQQTIDVVEFIKANDDHESFTVLPSADLITTIRQYDARVRMPYGRDMFNPKLNYYHPAFEVYEKPERLNFKNLVEVSRYLEVEYIIVYAARLCEDSPEEAGLEYVGTVDDHLIYRDPVVSDLMKSIDQYYVSEK